MDDTKIKEELKPCPLCGGVVVFNTTSLPDVYSDHEQVECTKCGLSIPIWGDKPEVLIKWNTRTAERLAKIEGLEIAKQMFLDLDEMNPVDYTDSFDVINTLLEELKAGQP